MTTIYNQKNYGLSKEIKNINGLFQCRLNIWFLRAVYFDPSSS